VAAVVGRPLLGTHQVSRNHQEQRLRDAGDTQHQTATIHPRVLRIEANRLHITQLQTSQCLWSILLFSGISLFSVFEITKA